MSKARLVIVAVTVEERPVSEVARAYGVSRSWVCALVARYRAEGEAAFEPRSRRPKTSPAAISAETAELIVKLRKELSGQGLDAGPDTICWHLQHHHQVRVSAATISRYLTRAGLVTPEPQAAEVLLHPVRRRAAERMLAVRLHPLALAGGTDARSCPGWMTTPGTRCRSPRTRVTGPFVLAAFRAAVAAHGAPASTLTDNGMVFTTRLSGGSGGRNGLEHELRRLGITQKNGKPGHPQTQGKVERFQQTLKKWLAAQPPARHPRRAAGPAGHLHQLLQHPAAAPVPAPPRHPRRRLHRPAQGRSRRRPADSPRPRPRRPRRRRRQAHPPPRRQAPPHRHRPNPRPDPRPDARPRPAHPRHQRRHRRTAPRAHPQPRPQLPAHRQAPRTPTRNTPQKKNPEP